MSISKIKTGSITTDAITEAKVADNAIENEHINSNVITGQTELAEAAAGTDVLLVYDTSAGIIKKVTASNVGLQAPTLSSISPTSVTSGDGTGNYTFTFTGTGFAASAVPTLITTGGSSVSFDSFTINSSTQITAVIAKSSLTDANEPYDARITVAGGLTTTLTDQITVDESPIFNTAAGSLGSFSEQTTISTIDIEAYDPDSAGNITFEVQSGSLPAGLSATTVHENGVSKYRITGTLTTDQSSFTTTNFTLRAVDAASNTSSRAFSISEVPSGTESFTSSGTFSVPTGITAVDILVVAGGGGSGNDHGGGGGAGGLIFMPCHPVTPGGTVSVTVGCGGAGGTPSSPGPNNGASGQDSIFGDLTAKGGGGGGGGNTGIDGNPGGSGGGGTGHGANNTPSQNNGGSATQPTQPGNSGAYGFGNGGGFGLRGPGPLNLRGGGGGGAGVAGSPGQSGNSAGGDGKAYTIADGTTSVYYAGGGAGGHYSPGSEFTSQPGGQGGGGDSIGPPSCSGQDGAANKGGGGAAQPHSGGKGIVIVSY